MNLKISVLAKFDAWSTSRSESNRID